MLEHCPPSDSAHTPAAHIAILLCTYQGEVYLSEQLDSIAAQSHPHWTLWVSDDGSRDGTRDILEAYQRRWGQHRIRWRQGPLRGFAANFNSLLADANIQADAFALADQDDIWHPDKLERAVAWLGAEASEEPRLYTARTRLVDARGGFIGISPACRAPGFANALVQNIASGNTMVLNAAARQSLIEAGPPRAELHDWWCYQWISGIGGEVLFDSQPCLDYRQHGGNQIGMQTGLISLLPRVKRLWQGQHCLCLDSQLAALEERQSWLTPIHRQLLQSLQAARRRRGLARLYGVWQTGVYRQSRLGQWAMYMAAILNKF